MEDDSRGIMVHEEVLDLTIDSDEDIVKQEENNEPKPFYDFIFKTNSNMSRFQENKPSDELENRTEVKDLSKCRSSRTYKQCLEKAVAVIKKGGSLDTTALKYGIPRDAIYDRLIARALPKETDVLTSDEELCLVEWILRENKKNSIVMKNQLLEKVGKMKKIVDITPIFAKSKFGKMWYEHFLQHYPEIHENSGILMPSSVGVNSSEHASTSSKNIAAELTDIEENELVEWIIEMNHQNQLVFKHDLLEKVQRLKNYEPTFAKSLGKKWYKQFIKKHKEIYENEELLMPSTSKQPVNKLCKQNTTHAEPFPKGPLKLKKNYTKQLQSLGFKKVVVVLHDYRMYKKHLQKHGKKGPSLQDKITNCLLKNNKQKSRSTLQSTKFDRAELTCDLKSNTVNIEKESGPEQESSIKIEKITSEKELEGMACDIKIETVTSDEVLDPLGITEIEKKLYHQKIDYTLDTIDIRSGTDVKHRRNNNAMSKEFVLVKREKCGENGQKKEAFKEADRPVCIKCQKTFRNKSKLIRHLYTHIPKDQYTFTCNECLKRFPSKYHLSVHKKIAHSTKNYHCDECESVFKHNTSLRKHKRTIHLHFNGIKYVKSKTFICDVCKKSFNYKKSLEYHILYGHFQEKKKYPCNVCKRRFIKYSLMLRHKLRHIKIKPFVCNVCRKSFSRKYLLREHSNHCSKNASVPKEEEYKKLSIDYLKILDLD